MGKIYKKKRQQHTDHHDNPARTTNTFTRRQHSQNVPATQKVKSATSTTQRPKQHAMQKSTGQQRLKVPFTSLDQVLLVGEGDLSFTLSLKRHYKIRSITATCHDTREVLVGKYPTVERTLAKLQPGSLQYLKSSVTRAEDGLAGILDAETDWQGFSPANTPPESGDKNDSEERDKDHSTAINIYFGVDATKLSSAHRKILRPYGPFTKIVFNFPHVGGLSTDVNRQVRSNQELLVGFFKAAIPLLATPSNPVFPSSLPNHDEEYASDEEELEGEEEQQAASSPITEGQILVTLFEGEPYTLWNIRDLARHCGLHVLESFKFSWSAYPGYQHARTIGDITTGKDQDDGSKRKGAWRGEERDARCYVLALKGAQGSYPAPGSRKRKKAEVDDSD